MTIPAHTMVVALARGTAVLWSLMNGQREVSKGTVRFKRKALAADFAARMRSCDDTAIAAAIDHEQAKIDALKAKWGTEPTEWAAEVVPRRKWSKKSAEVGQ